MHVKNTFLEVHEAQAPPPPGELRRSFTEPGSDHAAWRHRQKIDREGESEADSQRSDANRDGSPEPVVNKTYSEGWQPQRLVVPIMVPAPEIAPECCYGVPAYAQPQEIQHNFGYTQPYHEVGQNGCMLPPGGDGWQYAPQAHAEVPQDLVQFNSGQWMPAHAQAAVMAPNMVGSWAPTANSFAWNQFNGGGGQEQCEIQAAGMRAQPAVGTEECVQWWPRPPVQMWMSQGPPWPHPPTMLQAPAGNALAAMAAMSQPCIASNTAPTAVAVAAPRPSTILNAPTPPTSGPPLPQSLYRRESLSHGFHGVRWIVDGRKLAQNNKQAVSPAFGINIGDREVAFKLILYPKSAAEGNKRGGGSFKKTRGRGHVQLKCDSELSDASGGTEVTFSIGVGRPEVGAEHEMRGPVHHNFAHSAVCGLERDEEEWDFTEAVDSDSWTFGVSLDISLGGLS